MNIEPADVMKYLERLLGTWIGEGTGEYPTIATFPYREALTFTPAEGKNYLHFDQRTWRKDESGKETPSHWETGYWRILPNSEVEFLCVQASGRIEVARGRLAPMDEGFVLGLQSSLFANDTRVDQTWREFELKGNILRYSLQMRTSAVAALTLHAQAQLEHSF